MLLTKKRPAAVDEEFGKKDDDYWRARERSKLPRLPKLPSWRALRRRRVLLIIFSVYILYVWFSKSLNPISTDKPCESTRQSLLDEDTPGESVPSSSAANDVETSDFDGPIRFAQLSTSLRNIEKKLEDGVDSNNVLFAAASLTGISELIPLACDMASEKTNNVHFVIMGRHELPMRTLLKVNGVGATECPVYWHDARPDNGQSSSENRMEKSVRGGLDQMKKFIEPQVIITNNYERDELFLLKGITHYGPLLGISHIILPHAASALGWISDLDTDSLKAWGKFHIEILIQAPSQSSGSFLRLLKSLDRAGHLGNKIGLTIELPQKADPLLLQHLKNWEWSPDSQGSKITLRRRIQSHGLTPEESAARTVEAFYPQNPAWSHVLLLSSQTELSPSYFHYLWYTVLKYKYSAETELLSEKLLGISLELPSSGPTESDNFTPFSNSLGEDGLDRVTPLALWQAPHSNAVLYFGDKWAELHNFVSNSLNTPREDTLQPSRVISKKYPAFMEYLLELTRARGYYTLYPFFYARTGVSLATVHNELYQPPEEYALGKAIEGQDEESSHKTQGLGSFEQVLYSSRSITDLLRDLPLSFPALASMPILSYTGEQERDIVGSSISYATEFSKQFGDCSSSIARGEKMPLRTDDLFCLDGVD